MSRKNQEEMLSAFQYIKTGKDLHSVQSLEPKECAQPAREDMKST